MGTGWPLSPCWSSVALCRPQSLYLESGVEVGIVPAFLLVSVPSILYLEPVDALGLGSLFTNCYSICLSY